MPMLVWEEDPQPYLDEKGEILCLLLEWQGYSGVL